MKKQPPYANLQLPKDNLKKENLSFAEKRNWKRKVRRLTNKVSKLEGEIEETERLIASMDQLFAEAGYTHSGRGLR